MRCVLAAPVITATIAHHPIQLIAKRFIRTHSIVPLIGILGVLSPSLNQPIYQIGNIAVRGAGKDAKEENQNKNH